MWVWFERTENNKTGEAMVATEAKNGDKKPEEGATTTPAADVMFKVVGNATDGTGTSLSGQVQVCTSSFIKIIHPTFKNILSLCNILENHCKRT